MFNKVQLLNFPGRRRQGFTIVEIVVAFIIIGILTLVMVPVLTHQSAQARLNACEQDLEHLANAQDRACIDTGYLYRPYVLNDVVNGDGYPNAPDPLNPPTPPTGGATADVINGIRDNFEAITGSLYLDPHKIFIAQNTGDYVPDSTQDSLFIRLTGALDGTLLPMYPNAEIKFRWNGPYLNWRRDVNNNDWPDDPWGNDYLYFTQAGVLYPPDPRVRTTSGSGSGGSPTTINPPGEDNSDFFKERSPMYDIGGTQVDFEVIRQTTRMPIFDRPTWLSLGPDGIPGSVSATTGLIDPADVTTYGFGKGDDIIRQ